MIVDFAGIRLIDRSALLFGRTEINGANIVDAAPLVQQAAPAIFSRGNRTNTIKVTSYVHYTTYGAATNDRFMLPNSFPDSGILTITTGEFGEATTTITAANCVLQTIDPVQSGRMLAITYTFLCGALAGGDAPSIISLSPLVAQKIKQSIANGATTAVVVFGTPFASGHIPACFANVVKPSAANINIFCEPILDTLSETGVTFKLSSPAPTAGYELDGLAIY